MTIEEKEALDVVFARVRDALVEVFAFREAFYPRETDVSESEKVIKFPVNQKRKETTI